MDQQIISKLGVGFQWVQTLVIIVWVTEEEPLGEGNSVFQPPIRGWN